MDVFGFPFCRGRIFVDIEKDQGQYDDIVDVVWTSGNCMITKAEVIRKVGMLDEIFFIYGEEADLCWRMFFHGYRLVYIPNSFSRFGLWSAVYGKNRERRSVLGQF